MARKSNIQIELESREEAEKALEIITSNNIGVTKNVIEAIRRKFFLKDSEKPENTMILLQTPGKICKKDRLYFKPFSKEQPRQNNWYDATDELVKIFDEVRKQINFKKLQTKERNSINHTLFIR